MSVQQNMTILLWSILSWIWSGGGGLWGFNLSIFRKDKENGDVCMANCSYRRMTMCSFIVHVAAVSIVTRLRAGRLGFDSWQGRAGQDRAGQDMLSPQSQMHSHQSVPPKIFVLLVCNREVRMGFPSGEYEKHGFSD